MTSVAMLATHGLGSECLRLLDEAPNVEIPVVVTYPPDADNWWDDDVHSTATDRDLHVLPITEQSRVLEFDVDYLLSVYYPEILGSDLLDHPAEGALNLHQAELPRYRGSNVFAHAIMNARDDDHWRYGTTLHEMVEEVDAGPIVDRAFVEIREDDTARTLYGRTVKASVEFFQEWIPCIGDRTVLEKTTPQDEFDGERYFYRKDSLDDFFEIQPSVLTGDRDEQLDVYDRIRALEFPPLDPAYTTIGDRKVYLTTRPNQGPND